MACSFPEGIVIQSLMQDVPLTLNHVRERVERLYADKTVTTRYADAIDRACYGDVLARSGRLADALHRLGARSGDRVATLAWNSRRHLELYIAVPCMGAVLHTVNARLPGETIGELLAHAADSVLFVDRSPVGALAGLAAPTALRHVVVMDDRTSEGARDVAPFGALDSLRQYVERDLRILQMTIIRNFGNVLACPTVSNPKSPVSSPSTTCWPGDR